MRAVSAHQLTWGLRGEGSKCQNVHKTHTWHAFHRFFQTIYKSTMHARPNGCPTRFIASKTDVSTASCIDAKWSLRSPVWTWWNRIIGQKNKWASTDAPNHGEFKELCGIEWDCLHDEMGRVKVPKSTAVWAMLWKKEMRLRFLKARSTR